MELKEIVEDLKIVCWHLFSKGIEMEIYIYGSILVNTKFANDIDILILYKYYSQLIIIKKEFNLLSTFYPLHVIYFTKEEEEELNYINDQKAKRII